VGHLGLFCARREAQRQIPWLDELVARLAALRMA
jgi:hypothetical protein